MCRKKWRLTGDWDSILPNRWKNSAKKSINSDLQNLKIKVDETNEYFKAAEDAFGDILPVKHVGKSLTCWLTQDLVHIMGMQNMCYALYDYPDEFVQVLNQLADDYLKFF